MPENLRKNTVVDCRNFDCINNRRGICTQERITLQPQGSIINRLMCAEAERRTEEAGTTEKRMEVTDET